MAELQNIDLLVIEDNPGDARLISEYLKESFLQFQPVVELAENLEEGIASLREQNFDIILLDLSLPDSFGLSTFEKVDQAVEMTPVIVLTGLEDEKLGVEAVQLGAQDFLIKKDITGTLLSRAILYALERSHLSQQLEKKQERLLEAQRLANMGNFEQDLESGELVWSDELFRIFDMAPNEEEPTFSGLMGMIQPDDRSIVTSAIKKIQQQEVAQQHVEVRVNTKSGNKKVIHSIINPIQNQHGEVVKVFGTTQDITERIKAEKRLQAQERRYRMLFQAATDEILVFQLDDDMNPLPFMEVNDVACDLLGYTREELLQQTIYDVVAAEKEEVEKRIANVVANKKRVHETQHLTKEGNIVPLEISATAFKLGGKPTIISIGRDVRERRKLEQQILNISEQERQRIGRDLHDDLGQMLTGVGLIAQNLADRLKPRDEEVGEKVQEIADLIKEADERARALSRGLVPVNVEANGLDHALRELTKKASRMYEIDIQYSYDEYHFLEDNSSAVHLYRIAQEAINNAIKHSKGNTIDVELQSNEDYISVRIEDDGNGFSKSEEIGDGMGMRIMNFRAQMIGGNLEINSEQGEGTEVRCQVPLKNT